MVNKKCNSTMGVEIDYHTHFFHYFFCIFFHEKGAKTVPLLDPPFLRKFMHFWPYLTALRPNFFLDFFVKMVIYQYYGNILIKWS